MSTIAGDKNWVLMEHLVILTLPPHNDEKGEMAKSSKCPNSKTTFLILLKIDLNFMALNKLPKVLKNSLIYSSDVT